MKYFLLGIGFFAVGFLTHALFLPDVLSNGIFRTPDFFTLTNSASNIASKNTEHETLITYNNGSFNRSNITIPLADYLIIRNESESSQMLLVSDVLELSTKRGYSYKEQVKSRMDHRGEYHVRDSANTARLTITVK